MSFESEIAENEQTAWFGRQARRGAKSHGTPAIMGVNAVMGSLGALLENHVVELQGEYLALDPDNDDEGVFFVPVSGAPVRAIYYLITEEKRLRCVVPSGLGSESDYALELRTRRPGGALCFATWHKMIATA